MVSCAAPTLLAFVACGATKKATLDHDAGAPPMRRPGSGGSSEAGTAGSSSSSGGASSGSGGASSSSGGSNSSSGGSNSGSGGVVGAAFRCPSGPFGAPVSSGATAQRIDGVPPLDAFNDSGRTRTNIEGAVWISDTLYVSEFPLTPNPPDSRILAIDPVGASVSVAIPSSGTNGLAVDAAGNLVGADHKIGAIVRISFPLGTPTTLVGSYGGRRFNSPNDLAVRSDGNIYFSDPDYQAPNPAPQAQTRLYRLAPGASEVSVIDATRSEPNGVTLSADERTLYVSATDGIDSYPVLADGGVTPGSGVHVAGFSGGADGLGMDCAGNLYATSSQRIVVLSPAGVEIGSIAVSQAAGLTNVAFGGPERKTLFITSMGTGNQRGVFRVDLNVPGLPY